MSVPNERKIQVYPTQKYSSAVKAYAQLEELSVSEVAEHAIKVFIDGLPVDVRARIMNMQNAKSKNSY